jgi:hypothetical protein
MPLIPNYSESTSRKIIVRSRPARAQRKSLSHTKIINIKRARDVAQVIDVCKKKK